MELKLKVLEGKSSGQEIAVSGKKFFIGRADDCNLRPNSDLISRHHCVLLVEDGYVGVRDFGSKNGTFVNDERVVGERELKAGDRLSVGPLRFEVHLAHGLAAKKRPAVVDLKEAAVRAAHDAAQDPVDVTQWLVAETETTVPAATDTHAVAALSDTDAIGLSVTQTMAPETSEAQAKAVPPGKRPVGKLPPIQNSSKDSQEAAASALSKFRKRR
jgi:pSer/pThr/pTyr-binding forkhead associated (FHA) protein